MCGRFSLAADTDELGGRFRFDDAGLIYAPSYNIAPTQMALTVKNGDTRHASFMRWGPIGKLYARPAHTCACGGRVLERSLQSPATAANLAVALRSLPSSKDGYRREFISART